MSSPRPFLLLIPLLLAAGTPQADEPAGGAQETPPGGIEVGDVQDTRVASGETRRLAATLGPSALAVVDQQAFVAYQNPLGELHMAILRGGDRWVDNVVDRSNIVGAWVDVATRDAERIYLSYHDEGHADLRFARSTNGARSWDAYRTIATEGAVGLYTSIDVAADGRVYISFHDKTHGNLVVVRSDDDGETWGPVRVVDDDGNVGRWSALAVLDTDSVVVAYQDFGRRQMRFARSDDAGETWSVSTVDDAPAVGSYLSLVAPDPATIRIAYRDFARGALRVACSDSGGSGPWKIVDAVRSERAPAWTSMIAEDALTFHVAYVDPTGFDLCLATSRDGGSTWTARTIADAGDVGRHASLARSADGVLWISYLDRDAMGLELTRVRPEQRVGFGDEAPEPRPQEQPGARAGGR